MRPTDINLVTNNWLENYRKAFATRGIPNEIYYTSQHAVLEQLLPRATTIMACDPEDPDTVFGWLCFEVVDDYLLFHYIYVKKRFKAHRTPGGKDWTGFGIGTALIQEAVRNEKRVRGVRYSHELAAGRAFLRKMWDKDILPHPPVYDPYLMYSSLPSGWRAD